MNRQFSLRSVVLVLLLGLSATAPSFAAGAAGAGGTGLCPAIHRPIPSVEERQHLPPIEVMRCYMSIAEIDTVESAIGHDPQTTVTDPAFDSGELNPDGTSRPPLTAEPCARCTRSSIRTCGPAPSFASSSRARTSAASSAAGR